MKIFPQYMQFRELIDLFTLSRSYFQFRKIKEDNKFRKRNVYITGLGDEDGILGRAEEEEPGIGALTGKYLFFSAS